jgi:hypothetical protein
MAEPATEHCWHETGQGSSWSRGGHEEVVCCQCGATGSRKWHIEHHRIEGHGPYYKIGVRVAEKEVKTPVVSYCIPGDKFK